MCIQFIYMYVRIYMYCTCMMGSFFRRSQTIDLPPGDVEAKICCTYSNNYMYIYIIIYRDTYIPVCTYVLSIYVHVYKYTHVCIIMYMYMC